MKITYFVHTTTTDNEAGVATGWLDGELSKLGEEQSKKLFSQIADTSFEVVFASDLWRAVDSAQRVFGDTHEIRIDSRLREANYGDWNGKPHHFKENLTDFVDTPFPNGESYQDVQARIQSFVDEISEQFPSGHIAIVAHEGPQLALEVIVEGKTWTEAIQTNWRKTKAWQPGWVYEI